MLFRKVDFAALSHARILNGIFTLYDLTRQQAGDDTGYRRRLYIRCMK